MHLVVGLGNPGPEYARHRHNIGFLVVDELAERWRIGPFKTKLGGEQARGEIDGQTVVMLKPMEYMNLSGPVVQRTADFFQIEPSRIIAIHDELDLEFGRLKIKQGGGHGGHNGLRSLHEQIGPDYLRIRCGVGHPGTQERVVGHLLGPFSSADQKELPTLVAKAADAAEWLVRDGVTKAMNQFNQGS